MAQIIIRPISDISATSVTYSMGTLAYPLINEVTADGDTTTISWASTTGTATVKCTSVDTSKIKTINSVTLYVVYRGLGIGSTVGFGFTTPTSSGTTASTGTGTSYLTSSYTLAVNLPPASFDLTNIQIYFGVTVAGSKDTTYLTQAYVVVDYTAKSGFKSKVNGAWHDSTATYVKINGVWKTVSSVYAKIDGTWKLSG
jgi:hypothetical protein